VHVALTPPGTGWWHQNPEPTHKAVPRGLICGERGLKKKATCAGRETYVVFQARILHRLFSRKAARIPTRRPRLRRHDRFAIHAMVQPVRGAPYPWRIGRHCLLRPRPLREEVNPGLRSSHPVSAEPPPPPRRSIVRSRRHGE